MTAEERERLRRFAERTDELGLRPHPDDLLVLFEGWRGLQAHLSRIRRYLASDGGGPESDRTAGDGDR